MKFKDAGVKIKMKAWKGLLLLFVFVGALVSSCNSKSVVRRIDVTLAPESLPPTKSSTSVHGISQVLLIDKNGGPRAGFPMDAAKITAITLEKNILKTLVVYQGGCQEHIFELHAETAFLQSYESQGILYLSHDAHGDTCIEKMEKLLLFDLTPLDAERNDPSERPLLLRVYEPVGGSFAQEPYMPLIEWQ